MSTYVAVKSVFCYHKINNIHRFFGRLVKIKLVFEYLICKFEEIFKQIWGKNYKLAIHFSPSVNFIIYFAKYDIV